MGETLQVFVGVNIIAALGFYVTASTGLLSLGSGAFMAMGAYSAGLLTVQHGWPLLPALLASALISGTLAVGVIYPAVRQLQGIYFAVATLAVSEIVRAFLMNNEATGGAAGFRGMVGTTVGWVYGAALCAIAITIAIFASRLGVRMRAVGQDQAAAMAAGINPVRTKLISLWVGAALSGVAGALYAHYMYFINPEMFGWSRALEILLFVILGGTESVLGPILGALILTVLPEALRSTEGLRMIFYGGAVILMMAVRPRGLVTRDTVQAVVGRVR
jgi:branched-chain amino acid transport system permease protein